MAIFQVEYKDDGHVEFMVHFNTLSSARERFERKQHATLSICVLRAIGPCAMSRELLDAKGRYAESLAV